MKERMTNELRNAFTKGQAVALKYNDSMLRLQHVVFGILTTENMIYEVVKNKVMDFDVMVSDLNDINKRLSDSSKDGDSTILPFEADLQETIKECISRKKQTNYITVELFFMIFMEKDNAITKLFKDYGLTKTFIAKKIKQLSTPQASTFSNDDELPKDRAKITNENINRNSKTRTPMLDNFGRDLTALSLDGKLDPVIGRTEEVERVCQILTRRKKNNPILIGDPGVGKTAIAEGLAMKIATGECPRPLLNKRVVTLDMTSLVAGTKYRGQFEERIKAIVDEAKDNPNIILFIDEIHTIVGAGNSSGSLDAANVFKPALARGELQCIGATTLDEYREHIEKDGALDRRFQKVMVNPPQLAETKEILMNIKERYEDFHKVTYTEGAINEIIYLADRYITNREFPDKAIDIMDEAGSRTQVAIKAPQKIKDLEIKLKDIKEQKQLVVKTQNFEQAASLRDQEKKVLVELEKETAAWKLSINEKRNIVTEDMISEVVSIMTGIPISRVSEKEIEKLLSMDNDLANCVIGQSDAISKVVSSIKRNRTGIRKQSKPIGSFLFIGPTGVGKTELAKALCEKVFGSKDSMIRVDMSEYSEKFNISKLIGAPPGYVGYNEGGQLTEKVKNKPYSLILFDEIEKAHPDVFNVMLQLLDEGFLTDASGRKINFKNTIIIMTSNIGLKEVQDFGTKIGFNDSDVDNLANSKGIIEKNLKKTFKPEFINRLDEIVYFNYLNEEDITKIIDLQLKDFELHLKSIGFTFKIDKKLKDFLLEQGFNKIYGAREIQRTIQKYIEDPISDEMLKKQLPTSGKISLTYNIKSSKVIVNITE
jgi:ATP-dependent Clp protease ATP-binding subunit ClpC